MAVYDSFASKIHWKSLVYTNAWQSTSNPEQAATSGAKYLVFRGSTIPKVGLILLLIKLNKEIEWFDT